MDKLVRVIVAASGLISVVNPVLLRMVIMGGHTIWLTYLLFLVLCIQYQCLLLIGWL